jgi:hypothetical protein
MASQAIPKLGLHLGTHKPPLALRDYIAPTPPPVPPSVERSQTGFAWGMLANDRLGDCVIAMMMHSIEAFHLDAATAVPAFSDADAIAAYEAITGYNPANPKSDQGTDEGQAMAYWQHTGLRCSADSSLHTIATTIAVDPKNTDERRRAIWEFVAVQYGVALPLTAQGQTEWTLTDPSLQGNAAPGSWGGHGIPALSYDPSHETVITWGADLVMDEAFAVAYLQEAHVVVTTEMLSRSGISPAGIDWDALVRDINALPTVSTN